MFLSNQSVDEIVRSGKNIQQAISEVVLSATKRKYVILLHAPYDMKYESHGSVPITASRFRYGTIQQAASLSDSLKSMQHIAALCSNYLVYIEQMNIAHWRNATNLLVFPDPTVSERNVLTALYEGYSTDKIADILSLTPKTIRTYRANMYKKFQVDSSGSLIRRAIEMGFFRYLSK